MIPENLQAPSFKERWVSPASGNPSVAEGIFASREFRTLGLELFWSLDVGI
jgi:hypothetical protein